MRAALFGVTLLLLGIWASPAHAAGEPLPWKGMEIILGPSQALGEVRVAAEVAGTNVVALRIYCEGRAVAVPAEALAVMTGPDWRTVAARVDTAFDGVPVLYVMVNVDRAEGNEKTWPVLHFEIREGKLVRRFLARNKADGSRVLTDVWPAP